MPALDLKGCLEDSPKFRKRVHAHEETVQNFESSLKSLIKLARSQVNLSQEYSIRQQELAQGFLNFGQSQDDPIVAHALEKFGKSILEVEKCRNMFNAHVLNTFIEPLETFLKDNLIPIKEVKKRFEKSSDEVDTALGRYMGKKPKDPTIPESTMELADARKNFHQVYIEYVQRLNDIEAKKKVDYMENVLAYMYTESVFHHQSYEILKDLEPYMRDLTGLLHDSRQRFAEETSESQHYQDQCAQNTIAQYSPMNDNTQSLSSNSPSNSQSSITTAATKSGYLFEKRPGRVLQTWVRKYFMIEGEELTSTTRGPKSSREEDQPTSYNLRVCSVRACDNYDRRYCFELISPSRIIVLQAENEHDMQDWISCIKAASQLALNSDKAMPAVRSTVKDGTSERNENQKKFTATNTEANMQLLKALRDEPGNDICADCGDTGPEWASTNLGVVICIECSGIHRSLGVHVSKVRSIALDKWESESIEVMLRLGNDVVNNIFEADVAVDLAPFKIHKNSPRSDRDLWITEKYVKRSFVKKQTQLDADALNQAFWDAAAQSDLPKALQYLAEGAAVDYKHPGHHSQTPLHKAVEANDDVVVEFLLQWFADVNQTDGNGWTALHYAAASNNVRLVLSLLRRHAKADAQDNDGKTALDLAVDRQNVQSVTALRLFAFDKQHNSSPASSLDFGFREAMSSFKDTNTSERSVYSNIHSHSALDLRHASNSELAVEDKVELHDDQNHKLL